jgi:hypothetical protein
LLRRLVVGKLNHPRINPLASFGYVYVMLRHVADRPAMAVNTPPCGPSCYGGQHPTGLTGSCGRIRIRVAAAQSWLVRRPPGFIEPCRKTHRRASYWGSASMCAGDPSKVRCHNYDAENLANMVIRSLHHRPRLVLQAPMAERPGCAPACNGGAPMPSTEHTLHFPQRVDGPLCPKCETAMLIISIEPLGLGYDLRTFECRECQREEMKVVHRA